MKIIKGKIHYDKRTKASERVKTAKEQLKKAVSILAHKLSQAPIKMLSDAKIQKNGSILLSVQKIYKNAKLNRIDTAEVTSSEVKKLKKADLKEFKEMLREKANVNNLRVDSQSTALNLSNHDRVRQMCYYNTAKCLERRDLIEHFNRNK